MSSRYGRLIAALTGVQQAGAELGRLDAAVGDGDLGLTISAGAQAAVLALQTTEDETSLSRTLVAVGRAFGNANPSTFAALVQGGLLAAAKELRDHDGPVDAAVLATMVKAVATSIAARGGAAPGDKTVLDALLASIDAMPTAGPLHSAGFRVMAEAAADRTAQLTDQVSARGRAKWVGDRSIGIPDPGSVAYTRFLQALAEAFDEDQD